MSLAPGTKVGPYEILAPIGAGGMGEVYRARDSKLNRDVAIKVLPAALANDADYLARSQREAQVLASLNHPNIAAIYGLEGHAIVMELVEGEVLADRISRGPLPVEEALPIARQIAEALEAAHEKGIIHRDLKPGNIKLTPDGIVKVLDFGLAKTDDTRSTSNASISPTLTIRATEAGLILGTAAYMSPEQASGKPVDKRADIWSFGVVLWEMLTGRRLFEGETISHTLAHVLTAPIDWNRLPSKTPPAIRNLLRRCLDRNIKTRLRDIGEARITLAEPMVPASTPLPPPRRWLQAVATALLVSTVVFAFLWLRTPPALYTPVVQFEIASPSGTVFTSPYSAIAVSPDGRFVVFAAATLGNIQRLPRRDVPGNVLPSGNAPLWLRPLDSSVARPLEGTEGANFPFWSPDNKSIAFFQGGRLKRTEVAGGSVQALCDGLGLGGSWNTDGTIVFQGGAPRQITEFAPKEFAHAWPQFLPDGKRFLFFAANNDPSEGGIYAASLKDPRHHVLILPTDGKASYVQPRDGSSRKDTSCGGGSGRSWRSGSTPVGCAWKGSLLL
jgi:serine/threonine protein kinase